MNSFNVLCSLITLSLFAMSSCSNSSQENENDSDNEIVEEENPQWLHFSSNNKNAKKIVLISGDEEYRSEESMPQMGKILSQQHGFDCTVLFSQNPQTPGTIDPTHLTNIPGLEHLDDADLMIIFTRFRKLPDEQMKHIDDYLKRGGPVIGLRTATHAFNFDTTSNYYHYSNGYNGSLAQWKGGFGRFILGEKWISHHGHHRHQSTRGIIAPGAENHPITNGIQSGDIWGPTDVYGVRLPLPGDSKPIILGQVINRVLEYDENDPLYGLRKTDSVVATENPARKQSGNPNDPMMPVAWTKTYSIDGATGKVFTTTMGSSTDLLSEGLRRLLVNAVYWSMDLEVPTKTSVEIVGDYQPTAYNFKDKKVWLELAPKIKEKK